MRVCPAMALLSKECQSCEAIIHSYDQLDHKTQHKLMRLGICKGCPISLEKNTLFSDPIVLKMNNAPIAIRRQEAEQIIIELKD